MVHHEKSHHQHFIKCLQDIGIWVGEINKNKNKFKNARYLEVLSRGLNRKPSGDLHFGFIII